MGLSKRFNEDMVKTLGELKTGDTFYLIHWQGDHISSIESKVVDSILDIKIGRIINYCTDKENKTGLGFTLKTNELNESVIYYHYHMHVCSDKNVLYEIKNTGHGKFVVNSSKVEFSNLTESSCELTILTGKSGNFDLIYQRDGEDDIVLNITIESF